MQALNRNVERVFGSIAQRKILGTAEIGAGSVSLLYIRACVCTLDEGQGPVQMVLSENAIFTAQIFSMSEPANVTTYLAKVELVRGAGGKEMRGNRNAGLRNEATSLTLVDRPHKAD